MKELCTLYILEDDQNNPPAADPYLWGTATVVGDGGQVSVGQKLKMCLTHEEEMDEVVHLKIIRIVEGSPKKLVLCFM